MFCFVFYQSQIVWWKLFFFLYPFDLCVVVLDVCLRSRIKVFFFKKSQNTEQEANSDIQCLV